MHRYADTSNVTISSMLLPEGMTDIYDEVSRIILIDRQFIYYQTRYILVHELNHWKYPMPPEQSYTAHT